VKFEALLINARVVCAMLLREARIKYGRTSVGYLWAIVEPVFFIAVLSLLFTAFRSTAPFGESFALFFATGVLPFQLFQKMAHFVGDAFDANRPLFNYPLVKPMDAVISRAMLEFSTSIVVMTIVFGIQIIIFEVAAPNNILKIIQAMMLMALLGFGTGLTNASVRKKFPAWGYLFGIIMGPSFFVSGIFFTLQSIPTYYRSLLAWNPLIHGIEGFRDGYFPNYRSFDLDLAYLFWWGISLTFIGLIAERTIKRDEA